MRSGTTFSSAALLETKKRNDYFQRKKVGSIRDNPKLLKIRQQFENASQDSCKDRGGPQEVASAPNSISLSKNRSLILLDELKVNSDKTETFLKSQMGASHNRRNSESDLKDRKSLSVASYENSPISTPSDYKSFTPLNLSKADDSSTSDAKRDTFNRKYNPLNSSSESGVHTISSASEEDSTSCYTKPLRSPRVNEDANKFFRNLNENAPPIPRRGISPAVQNSFIHSESNRSKKSHTTVSDGSSVQKAIMMYEGMSSPDGKKNKGAKSPLRRDDSTSSRRSVIRRHSRRNSMRKSKHLSDKDVASPTKRKDKDDSGIGDVDDRMTENIYQTLTNTTVTMSPGVFDPYDRLNRLHDVANRVHKGQPNNCAACKAIPSSVLQYRTNSKASFMQVKCNELAPHHHPPCICFACQHSIFSCCESATVPPAKEKEDKLYCNEDALYYNICCLNSPNREGWRQSRRRPVCEQNGRLCIVNCDMEKCSNACSRSKMSEEFYEKLSECHSPSLKIPQQKVSSKQVTADSCDSDEGWVDITDSEDEKPSISSKRCPSSKFKDSYCNPQENLTLLNEGYNIDQLVIKCMDIDISRAVSTEHLYESIADIDSQTEEDETTPKEHISNSSQGSITGSLKGVNPENELDSGEWSTESASPTFGESSNKDVSEQKGSTMNQYRFTVNYEIHETAKKTFMKSILGKKEVPKKRRMSNFFVPWLVPSQEYGATSNSPKVSLKKQNSRGQVGSKSVSCKNKRSHSVSSSSPKMSLSCTKTISSSSELLEEDNDNENGVGIKSTENSHLLPPNISESTSSRGSIASSTYLRTDQLQAVEPTKSRTSVPNETVTDVSVERVHKRTPSGNSDRTYIMFQAIKEEDVPLYQFYERNIKERVSFCRSPKSLSPIMWSTSSESCSYSDNATKPAVPQLSVVEQLSPDAQDMKMLWCELPEVKDSGILERISAQELKLQEAIFEFIQSQASYIRSLRVLYDNFIRTPEFSDFESPSCVLSKHETDVLFSDIVRVKEVSESLLKDLTARWNDAILIPDICDIIHCHAILPTFSVYVRYCTNRVYQERTLKELKETRLCFLEVLRKLEANPICQGLSLESFLFLPMQHIARLPLLLDNIFRWLVPDSPSYGVCKSALEAVHKVFVECNEGARRMERLEEMFVLNKQLEFKECKVIPLISASRWLLKKGELMKLEFDKKTFGRSSRCVRVPIYIFLFNDILVVTKKKNDDSYSVVDYCMRDKVQAMPVNAKELQQPVVVPNTCRYLIYLTLFNNHQGSAVDMILNCALLSERTRWIEAINCVPLNKPCEVWEYDCPQVQCVRSYIAQQPDELSLQESDVVTIHRKMNDGWYEGRRLRDGLQGWFPASYTMDIPCSRARASNLRQCYRLLMLSQNQ